MTRSLTSTGQINARSRFQYGPSGSRYKRIDEKNGSITRTLRYFGSVEKETTPTRTLLRQSIGGFLLINRTVSSNTREYRYLFADSLGSVDLITNENGAIIERMSFDAHGARRLNSSWVNPIQNYAPDTTLRGYTGHEMMDDLGLIHMNARIYDAELGRFLQADSMVEADATQGLNRYSYVLNNPLSSELVGGIGGVTYSDDSCKHCRLFSAPTKSVKPNWKINEHLSDCPTQAIFSGLLVDAPRLNTRQTQD